MSIAVACPTCGAKLKAPDNAAGRKVKCPKCQQPVAVPRPSGESAILAHADGPPVVPFQRPWWRNPLLIWLWSVTLILLVLLVVLIILLKSLWAAVAVIALLLLMPAFCLLQLTMAKSAAIRDRKDEVNIFGGMMKLVLWEANQGLVFLKNKRVHSLIYGPRDGGGTRFIFPVLGEEVRVRVPLTLKLTSFEDCQVLTRESVQLYMKVALWWRVADLEKYYYSIDKQVHVMTTEHLAEVEALDPKQANPPTAQRDAAEQWLLALAESCIRKLVSQATTALVVSKTATSYMHVEDKHRQPRVGPDSSIQALPAPGHSAPALQEAGDVASPGVLADEIKQMLSPKVQEYGLEINRVEIQEVHLPDKIQGALDEVFKATLKPAQTAQEAQAEQIRLQSAASVLGVETVALQEVMKSFRGSQFIGGMPKFIEALFARTAAPGQGAPALSKPDADEARKRSKRKTSGSASPPALPQEEADS
jgi:regulator of protease activity HflC (stomatin/prohibitin superfamily)